MMKFKLCSDLHLEFYRKRIRTGLIKQQPEWEPPVCDDDRDTVLLLPGDIDVGRHAKDWLTKMCDRFHVVVYVAGNHEFYGNEINDIRNYWRYEKMPSNFTYLDDNTCYVGDVRIIGGTLWTYVTDPVARWRGPKVMSDYNVIRIKDCLGKEPKLNVGHTDKLHLATRNYIEEVLNQTWPGKTIVMTHHLPHPLCVHKQWKNAITNEFFMTNLDHVIEKHDIDFWVHGHTHNNVDVEVHGTRILCNPMGYHGIQLNQEFNEDLTFEC